MNCESCGEREADFTMAFAADDDGHLATRFTLCVRCLADALFPWTEAK